MIGDCKPRTTSTKYCNLTTIIPTRLYTATLTSSAFRDFPKNGPRPETDNGATLAATIVVEHVSRYIQLCKPD